MEKLFNRLTILAFMIIIFGIGGITFFGEHKEDKSFYENRYLENPIPLNMESYKTGEFREKAEKAFSDHIYKRDEILRLYALTNRNVLHKNEVNKVVFGKGVLLPYYKTNGFNKEQTDEEIAEMTDALTRLNAVVEENGGKLVFAAIPAQFSVYGDKYPDYVCNYSPKLDYVRASFFPRLKENKVSCIDMKSVYKQREDIDFDSLYFATDHHFTCFGALVAYQEVMKELNLLRDKGKELKILQNEDLEFKTVDNKFLGSLSRKLYDIYPNEDKLTICYPKEKITFERYDNGQRVDAELFKLPEEGKYADYESFMGVDRPEVIIDTHRPELPSVLIFGDSYTNAMETLLYYSFDKMYSLDLRYYKAMSVADYIKEKKPDYVVYVRDDTIYLSRENNGDFFGDYKEGDN